jgi:hypothetical protein
MFTSKTVGFGALVPNVFPPFSSASPNGLNHGSTFAKNGMMPDSHIYADPDRDCAVIVAFRPGILNTGSVSDTGIYHPNKIQEGDFLFIWLQPSKTKREESIYFTLGQMNHFISLMHTLALQELAQIQKTAGSLWNGLTEDEIYTISRDHANKNNGLWPAMAFLCKRYIAENFVFFGIAVTNGRQKSGLDEGSQAVVSGFTHAKASFFGNGLMGNYVFLMLMPRKRTQNRASAYAFHLTTFFKPQGPSTSTLQYTEMCGLPSTAILIKVGTLTETTEEAVAMNETLVENAQGLPPSIDPSSIIAANSTLIKFGITLPPKILAPPIQV